MSSLPPTPERPLRAGRHVAARRQLQEVVARGRPHFLGRFGRAGVALGVGVGLSIAGGAAAATLTLTKGPIPSSAYGPARSGRVPDFVSVEGRKGTVVGYTPRRYVMPGPGQTLASGVAPVYASNLETLVGHVYPGVGYVPLGTDPASLTCVPEAVVSGATTSTIPCPSHRSALPDVVGMATPAGVVELQQAAGVSVTVQNGPSATVPAGHIVGTSPGPGSVVEGRAVVTVTNSTGPGPRPRQSP